MGTAKGCLIWGLATLAGALLALRCPAAGVDIVAQSAYLKTQTGSMGLVIDAPAIGTEVFVYLDYDVVDAAAPVTAQVRASLDGQNLCGGEVELESGGFSLFCQSPWVATAGQHTLVWELDVGGTVAETDETNNSAQVTFAPVDPARFDVLARRAFLRTAPGPEGVEVTSPALGQSVYLYTEYLLSGADFPARSSVRAILDGEQQCAGVNDLALGEDNFIYCTAPWTATAGMHTLRWELDYDDLLAEVDETNNGADVAFVTGGAGDCTGDCDDDGRVSINELIVGVTITLGSKPLTACAGFDKNGNGMVAINELIAAVNNALGQCA